MQSKLPHSTYSLDRLCDITIGKNIIEIHVHNGKVDHREAGKIVAKLQELAYGKEYRILVNCAENARISFSALRLLSKADAFKYAYAKAYIISSVHQRFMAFLFSSFFSTKAPVKFFRNEADGVKWLNEIVVY